MKKEEFSRCNLHTDCFANKGGCCVALKTGQVPSTNCPFYKTKQEASEARLESYKHLVEIGREDLIKKYGGQMTHGHQQI